MIGGANDEGTPLSLNGQYVGGSYIGEAFGSTVAGPMWNDAMEVIDQHLDDKDFQSPPSDPTGDLSEVPDVHWLSVPEAEKELQSDGFNTQVGSRVASRQPKGKVVNTTPSAGRDFAEGDLITLHQSTGRSAR